MLLSNTCFFEMGDIPPFASVAAIEAPIVVFAEIEQHWKYKSRCEDSWLGLMSPSNAPFSLMK